MFTYLEQFNPFHILPLLPRLLKLCLRWRLSGNRIYTVIVFTSVCYMHCPSYPTLYSHPEQISSLCNFLHSSVTSCTLGPNTVPWYFVLKLQCTYLYLMYGKILSHTLQVKTNLYCSIK